MRALCMMHNLNIETCLKKEQSQDEVEQKQQQQQSSPSPQKDDTNAKIQLLQDMQLHPDKFVKRSPFFAITKKN